MDENFDLESVIQGDIEHKKGKQSQYQMIPFKDYLGLVAKDPKIAQSSPSRLWEIIQDRGVKKLRPEERWGGIDRTYELFSKELFGIPDVIYKVANHIKGGASHSSSSKYPLLLVGPPGTGKSTLVDIMMEALEGYRKQPVFMIKDCPKFEEPLHLLPRYMREEVEKTKDQCGECSGGSVNSAHLHLGVRIEGDLCPICRHMLMSEYGGENKRPRWEDVPVETFNFSMQATRGLTIFTPSGEMSSDITDLTGKEIVAVTTVHGHSHHKAYELTGKLPRGERGIVQFSEILSGDKSILVIFFSSAEEKRIEVQGSNFPHISVDTSMFAHTNLTAFKEFSSNKKFEGLHDRFKVVSVHHILQVKEEERLYRKLIEEGSDFTRLSQCHTAPGTFRISAIFAVLTRLVSSKTGLSLMAKLKLYNGELSLTKFPELKEKSVNLGFLLEEGQSSQDIARREGMFGVSPRAVLHALDSVLVDQSGKNGCLTPMKAIQALRQIFDQRMGYSPEEVERYRLFLNTEEGDSVVVEYQELVMKFVNQAFLRGYKDLARAIFNNYIREIQLERSQSRKFIQGQVINFESDELTGKPKGPDMKLIRSVELQAPLQWTDDQAQVGRGEILEFKGSQANFDYDTYPPLAQAVENKLLNDSKELFSTILNPDVAKNKEESHREQDLLKALKEDGHCDTCARDAVYRAWNFIKEH